VPIDTTHPEYDAALAQWLRARAVLAGEDAVKNQRTALLEKIGGHDEQDYHAYLKRAAFYNAAARTAAGFVGMVFRRAPQIEFPAQAALQPRFETDTDLLGTPLAEYAREVFTEVLHVGRCATLISWDEPAERPHCLLYRAEDILNWRVERLGGKYRLTLVVLREWVNAGDDYATDLQPQYRVLRADPTGVTSETWRKPQGSDWQMSPAPAGRPLRRGEPLPFIPLVFHGPSHARASVSPLPLGDLIAVNLDHYRLDADYKHGLHFTALPTAYLAGFGAQTELKIGSGAVWMSENPQAKAGYLEYFGHGLTSFERALERNERLMATLGSRLLEPPRRQAETAEALAIRAGGEETVVGSIARAVSHSLSEVLKWAAWWALLKTPGNSPEDLPSEMVLLALNQDFGTSGLSAKDLQALVAGWQAGAFSHDTLLHLLRRGEVLPEGRTNEQERKLTGATASAEE
jgi:hypothetical protein